MIGVWAAVQVAVVALGVAVGGAAMSRVVHGATALRRSAHLRGSGCEATGTVVDTHVRARLFRPVVVFQTRDGEQIVTVAPKTVGGVFRRAAISRHTVPIRYDPTDPAYAEIAKGRGAGSDGLAYVATGVVTALAAVVAVVAAVGMLPR
jgi:hypothetical protein